MIASSFWSRIADKVEQIWTSRGNGYLVAPCAPALAVVQGPPRCGEVVNRSDAGSRRLDASLTIFSDSTAATLHQQRTALRLSSARSIGCPREWTRHRVGFASDDETGTLIPSGNGTPHLRVRRSEVPSSGRQAAPRRIDCNPPEPISWVESRADRLRVATKQQAVVSASA